MESAGSRFTAPEGGTRLAMTAAGKNILATEYASFITTRLIYEEAYKIRGTLSKGKQRSIYVTRASRVKCTAYELGILTDLTITQALNYEDVTDWSDEMEVKEVLVCTSSVFQQILQSRVLAMEHINVLIIDSCHLIFKDDNLKYIMKQYKDCDKSNRPRILAHTYPLFSNNQKGKSKAEDIKNDDSKTDDDVLEICEQKNETQDDNESENAKEITETTTTHTNLPSQPNKAEPASHTNFGAQKNVDDFDMYEKLEWKIEQLEQELCCEMDLAEDIDGGKRLVTSVTKPKEMIIEHTARSSDGLHNEDYIDLESFMRDTVREAEQFIYEHRYDPTEIYGDDLYEEFKNIPDPTIDPKTVFQQFLYVLEQLGPYGADKAAFSLLAKIEKLKIKVPYERHFLLLCLCTSVFVKIRCYADLIFSKYTDDWEKIKLFCTPKVHRFAEILEQFKPDNKDEQKRVDREGKDNKNDFLDSVGLNINGDLKVDDVTKGIDIKNDDTINKIDEQSGKNDKVNKEISVEQDTKQSEAKISKTHQKSNRMLEAIEKCDFLTLSNTIEDKVNIYESNLKDIEDRNIDFVKSEEKIVKNNEDKDSEVKDNDKETGEVINVDKLEGVQVNSQEQDLKMDAKVGESHKIGFKRTGHRLRGRGRGSRTTTNRNQNNQVNNDSLCGVVFVNEPLMAKILFALLVDMSRSNPSLSYICAQYCCSDVTQQWGPEAKQREDVLKKFRMHDCNLLLATSSLEEGIDLPRCSLVLRWDMPPSYRSYSLSRGRARAPRSAAILCSGCDVTEEMVNHLAVYNELDQIISRKCGCGIQNEPTQSEEDQADVYCPIVKSYTTQDDKVKTDNVTSVKTDNDTSVKAGNDTNVKADGEMSVKIESSVNVNTDVSDVKMEGNEIEIVAGELRVLNLDSEKDIRQEVVKENQDGGDFDSGVKNTVKFDSPVTDVDDKNDIVDGMASVDLNSAIALINRYCGKLPSDTFTRLAPYWKTEKINLPSKLNGSLIEAYVCTLRLPLNAPVKYNIVGHPMPTRVLARRMVALQACRILHKSGELDDQLMPIGKENFRAPLDSSHNEWSSLEQDADVESSGHSPRPGTTKRRQYYYKRTASAFTDCEPIIDACDCEVYPQYEHKHGDDCSKGKIRNEDNESKRNTLYSITMCLCCALPERYNTRGRRLHAPQNSEQSVAVLMHCRRELRLQIPAFPVYTRSGEVRVSTEYIQDADIRISPRRARQIRRFMRFVFAEVLRVRRCGMKLETQGLTHNNYYIVPTVKSIREDGTPRINVDWSFLELIYQYTEEKKFSELEKPILWHLDDEEIADIEKEKEKSSIEKQEKQIENKTDETTSTESVSCIDEKTEKSLESTQKSDANTQKSDENIQKSDANTQKSDENIQKSDANTQKPDEITQKSDPNTQKFDSHTQKSDSNTQKSDLTTQKSDSNKQKNLQLLPKLPEVKDKKDKRMDNPLLKPGEVFVFDAEKYKEAVVTPWYRNQDQPQFFLVAEICWHLRPDSGFSSAAHATFREYYAAKYGAELTQREQPLLDVDHTSARLNLLTPRYVNRKGVALPVSSERTRRAKRDRLDQKQILVPELCRVHPFAAPLWFATVALPCVLYRINALLIADEIRRTVALDVALGIPRIDENTCPGFQWPPLDFGWSLAEVLSAEEKNDKKKLEEENSRTEDLELTSQIEESDASPDSNADTCNVKTVNDILAEKENTESGFEIGTWSNEMASSIPTEYDEFMEPLPSNLTFCTSASGGTNWCDPVVKPKSQFNPSRRYSVADSDCSFMSSDFDTDSDLNSEGSDEDTDVSGFCGKSTNAMGVRIEYKTAHEAEAVEVERKKTNIAPAPDEADDENDRAVCADFIKSGDAPTHYIEKFRQSVSKHQKDIIEKSLIKHDQQITDILPETTREFDKNEQTNKELQNSKDNTLNIEVKNDIKLNNKLKIDIDKTQNNEEEKDTNTKIVFENETTRKLFDEIFPYKTYTLNSIENKITIDSIESNKRLLLNEYKNNLSNDEIKKLHLFSMKDVNIDSPEYVNEKLSNIGFDTKEQYIEKLSDWSKPREFKPYFLDGKDMSGEFDFDYQPDLEGHPGPSPSVILQALTMSNANDGINLERLETVGDSFLKFAITAHLYCAHSRGHEGKLSHMRSKQVSNLNLYRLGRNKRLGARMIAMKFEPHDNWLPPCHTAPPALASELQDGTTKKEYQIENTGCFIPYNLITQHSIPDKSIADCVEALIGAYLLECGPRGALLLMSWLGISVLPLHYVPLKTPPPMPKCKTDSSGREPETLYEEQLAMLRPVGSLKPRQNDKGEWVLPIFGELKAPPSPLLRYVENPEGELERMLSGYDALEETLQYRFNDRSLLLQAMTHASHHNNCLTDCYQRLEFLGDAILDYLITRHLYEDARRHSPGALTDLRSALVNNTIFATMAARHGFHKYFRHMSPGLNEVLTKYIKIQEENGHSISEEHYLIQEDEMEQAEDVEVPKALGDLFESVAGAIFLDSGMSLGAVWKSYVKLMGAELEAFSAAAPKSPVRELLEAEPDTAKFGKPERLADGRRVRVSVEVFGRGTFKGIGRNYRIAKGTAARCALRHLKADRYH